jgi:hypothetical protein
MPETPATLHPQDERECTTEGGRAVVAGDAPTSLMEMFWRAAKDPDFDVGKFEVLANLQMKVQDRDKEAEFNEALSRLSAKMPRVKKNGRVNLGNNKGEYAFSKWDDIDRVIRPLMAEEGFTLTFDSSPRQGDGGGIVVTGTLLHRNGHSRSSQMSLALDTHQARNNLQAMGSSLSYGKRYTAEMLLNIVREGSDDDGVLGGAEFISEAQLAEILKDMESVGFQSRPMLDLCGITEMAHMQKSQLPMARNAINMRKRKGQ